jgi:hypothetical protein
LKALVIAALFALFLLLVYSKIYPYLQALKKVFSVAKNITNAPRDDARGFQRGKLQEKLVRCVGCGTWIPSDRAIGNNAGASIYCSRECLENPAVKERKAAS